MTPDLDGSQFTKISRGMSEYIATCCAAVSMEAWMAAGDGLSPTLGTLSSTATWNRAAGTPLQTGPLTRRCNARRLSPVAVRTACSGTPFEIK